MIVTKFESEYRMRDTKFEGEYCVSVQNLRVNTV
jgi:hypothetical protein